MLHHITGWMEWLTFPQALLAPQACLPSNEGHTHMSRSSHLEAMLIGMLPKHLPVLKGGGWLLSRQSLRMALVLLYGEPYQAVVAALVSLWKGVR